MESQYLYKFVEWNPNIYNLFQKLLFFFSDKATVQSNQI